LNGDSVGCEEVIIRLLSRKKHVLPEGDVAPEAFILRPNDHGRLSFFRKAISDIPVCKAALEKLCGAATLHTGRVRAANYPGNRKIDVVEAEGEGTDIPGHSAMIGLPDPESEYEDAERVASILRKQSRLVSTTT
jgi:hypothetical protein